MTRRGKLWLSAAVGAVLSTVLIAAPAPAAARNDPAATAAVEELVRTGTAAAPGDFAAVMGYTPRVAKLADGRERSINPDGYCSVPGEGRPFAFDTACQAHDYGYDLLRYAQRRGEPLQGHLADPGEHVPLEVRCIAMHRGRPHAPGQAG